MTDDERVSIAKRADTAAVSRDFPLASRLYKSILKVYPNDIEILEKLGAMLIKSGDDTGALDIYKKIAYLKQNDAETLIILGGINRRLKNYEESVAILESAVAAGNSSSEVYYNLGFTYKLMGNYDSAIECFKKVIEENPKDVLAYNHLGSIYAQKADYTSAINSYNHGLKIDHNHPILHFNLAECYQKLGKTENALASYEAALKAKPLWTEAIEKYSNLLLETNNIESAYEIVENAVKLSPENSKMHIQLGTVYEKQSDWEKAKNEFIQALKYDEENEKAIRSLAKSQENLGEYNESVETMEGLSKKKPDDFDITRQYVGTLLSANYLDTAKDEIDDLMERDSKNLENLNLLAQYHLCRGDDEKTDETFKEIERKSPNFKKHLKDAGIRSNQIGKGEKAKRFLEKFLERNPSDAKAIFELAKACESLSDFSNALHFYNRASNLETYNVAAKKKITNVKVLVPNAEEILSHNVIPNKNNFSKNDFSVSQKEIETENVELPEETQNVETVEEKINDEPVLQEQPIPIEDSDSSSGDMIGTKIEDENIVEEEIEMNFDASMDNLLENEIDPFESAINGDESFSDMLVEPDEYSNEELEIKEEIKEEIKPIEEKIPEQNNPVQEAQNDMFKIPNELLDAAFKALAKEVADKNKEEEKEEVVAEEPSVEDTQIDEPVIENQIEEPIEEEIEETVETEAPIFENEVQEVQTEDEVDMPIEENDDVEAYSHATDGEVLNLLKKLRDLCDYLPEPEKSEFLLSEANTQMEYLIERFEVEMLS